MEENIKKQKANKGITLIALVVTIVVLLILSGITIGTLTSDNGIIKEATSAKEQTERKEIEEQIEMAIIKAEQKYRNPTLEQVVEEIKNSGVISDYTQVDWETGKIKSDLGYEIEGKLDDYLVPDAVYLEPSEWTYDIDENTNTATLLKYKGKGNKGEVVVPNYIITEKGNVKVKYLGNGSGQVWDDSICDYESVYGKSPSFVTKITISPGITHIADYAFMDTRPNLQEVLIPDSVESIGASAFKICTGISRVVIPENVSNIGVGAFGSCDGLTSVYFKQTTPPTFGNWCFETYNSNGTTFYFKNSTVSEALVAGTHYISSYGTKSTNYDW